MDLAVFGVVGHSLTWWETSDGVAVQMHLLRGRRDIVWHPRQTGLGSVEPSIHKLIPAAHYTQPDYM